MFGVNITLKKEETGSVLGAVGLSPALTGIIYKQNGLLKINTVKLQTSMFLEAIHVNILCLNQNK